jgi:conjugal transfer pilus assembly protein TrbC
VIKKVLLLLLGLCSFAVNVQAQSEEQAKERARQAIDAAMARARAQAVEQSVDVSTTRMPSGIRYDDIRRSQAVDPAVMAEQYKEMVGAAKSLGPDLLVFVSTSMPIPTLVRLAHQVRQAGGVMVFRGIKGGLSRKALNDWLSQIKPVADTGATMQIDPESFERYSVNAVPTFVIAAAAEGGCSGTHCATGAAALAGDVSLDYALEKFSARGGQYGKIADKYLDKLSKK